MRGLPHGVVARLRERDPGLVTVRHAVRTTTAAVGGFYACRYGLSDPVMAVYALFGAVAFGALSQLGGGPGRRAATLVCVLPVAYALIAAGTALAVRTWAAACGMLLVGFVVSYAGVGGPRVVGLSSGLQLFYILPCFPPYDPGSLSSRLAGVTIGVGLLAVGELLLWPDPPPSPYTDRLARAAGDLADAVDAVAAGSPAAGPGSGERALRRTREAMERLRFSTVPPMLRPASPGVRDRARSQAAAALRYAAVRCERLPGLVECANGADPRVTGLQDATARALRQAAHAFAGSGPAPPAEPLDEAIAAFTAERERAAARRTGLPDTTRLRINCVALDMAIVVRFVVLTTRVCRGAPVPPDDTPPAERPGPLWYADRGPVELWWHRARLHLTPRSVPFQSAVRTALALAAARVVAGTLDLSHGFWVMLATLTLMRGSASDTRTALRPALTGTLVGAAVAAALLLGFGHRPVFYVAALPVVMLIAFVLGPLLGVGWGQGLFTVVVAMAFGQLAPANWRLAEARAEDVLAGALVGAMAGLCAWPRGGSGELCRTAAGLLTATARVVEDTAALLTGRPLPRPGPGEGDRAALPGARHRMLLAEAAFAQYQSERRDPRMTRVDWQATLLAGQFLVRGTEALLRRCPPDALAASPRAADHLLRSAAATADAYREEAAHVRAARAERRSGPSAEALPVALHAAAADHADGPTMLHVGDAEVWLSAAIENLARISPGERPPASP
ncbi:FUSC family protein [Streptomyces sp. PTM05]|uniref:FUSC family protein n=1 Tax=Streptantibioticus parmotrematis TaxID=2873249 RepID=A0ABS7QMH8_9ACTN|nr:FUSC family protein [Streptantibioticus parmotrematis]MBY8884396.1 FUSC family protein [Streptantibioticus parmotrematis]